VAELTPNQREIVEASRAHCVLVNAGPGTGKTFVLVERFLWLLGQGVPVDAILLVTFTRKAAREVRERLGRRLLESGQITSLLELETAWIHNFHGFCARILREQALGAGFDPDSRLQDEVEAAELAATLRRRFFEGQHADRALEAEAEEDWIPSGVVERLGMRYEDAVKALGQGREHLLDRTTALERAEERLAELDAEPGLGEEERRDLAEERAAHSFLKESLPAIDDDYEGTKEAQSLLDFVDLQERAIALLRTATGDRVRSQFQAFLVDEFQDTNRAQLELLRLLAGDGFERLMAVGDERQSIYAFRGARVGNIRELPELVRAAGGPCEELELFESFRSYQELLDVSVEALRSGVEDSIPERARLRAVALGFARDDEGAARPCVRTIHRADRDGEAEAIAEEIERRVGRTIRLTDGGERRERPLRWGDFAILLRSVGSAEAYEEALLERGIPYRTFGGTGFFDRAEILDLLAYLRVIANPYDGLALVRVLQNPPFSLSQRSLYELANLGREAKGEERVETDAHEDVQVPGFRLTPWDAIRVAVDDPDLAKALGFEETTIERLGRLRELVERYLSLRETVPVSRLLLDVLAETGYGKLLQVGREGETALQALRRRKNVERLLRLARRHEERHVYGSLQQLVSYVNRAFEVELREEEEALEADDRVVNVMTVHQAKGKEWAVVFVAGLVDRSWPMRGGGPSDLLFSERAGLYLRRHVVAEQNDAGDVGFPETALARRVRAEARAERDLEERRVLFVAMTRAKYILRCCGHGPTTRYLDRVSALLPAEGQAPREPTKHRLAAREDSEPVVKDSQINEINALLARVCAPAPAMTRGNTLPRGVHLSYSQVDLYHTCPRRYHFTHILPLSGLRESRTPGESSQGQPIRLSPSELGSVFHEALERWSYDNPPRSVRDLADRAARERGWGGLAGADAKQADRFAAHFEASPLAERRPRRDEVEVPFTIVLDNDRDGSVVTVSGSIDRIDPDGRGRWVVTDFKTSRNTEAERYRLQLSVYRLALERALGRVVRSTRVFFVNHPVSQCLHEVEPLSLDATRATILDVAAKIRARDFAIRSHPGHEECWRCPFGGRDGPCPDKRLAEVPSTDKSRSRGGG